MNEFDLSPEEEADLDAAITEADAGLLTPLEEVIRRMHKNDRYNMTQHPVETEEEVELSPEELAELDARMEEAERGEGTDAFEFLKQLREGTWSEGM